MTSRHIAWLVAVLIAAWILSMTLRPGTRVNGVNLVPFKQKRLAMICLMTPTCRQQQSSFNFLFVDVLGNLVIFVPLGMAIALATLPRRTRRAPRRLGLRWWLNATALGFLLSLGIELAQLTIPTRATDVDDIILNTLGTLLGAAAVAIADQFRLKVQG